MKTKAQKVFRKKIAEMVKKDYFLTSHLLDCCEQSSDTKLVAEHVEHDETFYIFSDGSAVSFDGQSDYLDVIEKEEMVKSILESGSSVSSGLVAMSKTIGALTSAAVIFANNHDFDHGRQEFRAEFADESQILLERSKVSVFEKGEWK